jgi:hypothetical protein
MAKVVEDFNDVKKLGQSFTSVNKLEEVNLSEVKENWAVNRSKVWLCELLQEFTYCFAWNYTEMTGLSRELVEHVLPIKKGFR